VGNRLKAIKHWGIHFTCLSSTTIADKDEFEGWWGLRAFSHGGYVTL